MWLRRRLRRPALAVAVLVVFASACTTSGNDDGAGPRAAPPATTPSTKRAPASPTRRKLVDVYAFDRANRLSPAVAHDRPLVYVPNSLTNTVDVIDPKTFRIVEHFAVARQPEHVVPAYDLRTLYVASDLGNTLTPIDPRTAKPGRPIPVEDPYNLYFTMGGKDAIVVAERLARLDFRNASTMKLVKRVPVPCFGVDHLDFSVDGRYLIASCEYSSTMIKVDVVHRKVIGRLHLPPGAKPQDVRLGPRGRVFYVADMTRGGVYTIDGDAFRVTGFIPTGAGAHGLYPSRDSKLMYVTNRNAGTISLLSFATDKVVGTWTIPAGSPDMGGVSADGSTLWISGRYNAEVYAINTRTGALRARIHVGAGPHGLCVFPQPGRFSLGHTGIFR